MTELKKLENKGTEGVKKLRLQKLKKGFPFMINSKDLPANQCYLEYPDGRIVLAALLNHAMDFDIIRVLPENESTMLRIKYNLSVL